MFAGPKVPEAPKSHYPTPGPHPGIQAGRLTKNISFLVGVLKVNDENSRIRIRTKMSWIRNTDLNCTVKGGKSESVV
jgi:hypothetical protein